MCNFFGENQLLSTFHILQQWKEMEPNSERGSEKETRSGDYMPVEVKPYFTASTRSDSAEIMEFALNPRPGRSIFDEQDDLLTASRLFVFSGTCSSYVPPKDQKKQVILLSLSAYLHDTQAFS